MTQLSPAAQAVLDAFYVSSDGHYENGLWTPHTSEQIAAALRALADQAGSAKHWHVNEIRTIAAELEGGR